MQTASSVSAQPPPTSDLSRTRPGTVDQAIASITTALKEQGFGILSDIDVAATLKSKLGVSMQPYRILGACNPQLAHKAIQVDPSIGLLLPCNVVVRELEPGQVSVSIVDPEVLFTAAPNELREQLPDLAGEARSKLAAALAALA